MSEAAGAPRLGPGASLAQLRVARGLSAEDLALTLNLSLSTLRALEDDDLARLPSPIFVRGYLRAYARLLLVPSAPLLAAFEQRLAEAGIEDGTPPLPRYLRPRGLRAGLLRLLFQRPGWVMAGFSALGAVVLGLMVLGAGARLDTPESEVPEASRLQAAPLAPGGGEAVSLSPPEEMLGADGLPELWVGDGGARLELAYASESWTEVRNGADRLVYQGAPPTGTRLIVQGEGPFALRLGYAPGVRVSYNQMNVPLRPHTRNDVAQLVIGR
jgi:cytoskeleton protein RodZ